MSATHKYIVYRAKDGWRWYEVTSSDKTSESGEAYVNKQDAVDQAHAHAGDGVEVEIQAGAEVTYKDKD